MKRILILFAAAALAVSAAQAEALPGTVTEAPLVFSPESAAPAAEPTPAPQMNTEGGLQLDCANLLPDNAAATPVAIDPIDKPTPTPMPEPEFVYETYKNEEMGISFSIPYTWLLNPNTNQSTTIQFVEPKSEMMEKDGYQTRITIEKFSAGLEQTASDARTRLETVLGEMAQNFTAFVPGDIDSRSIRDAKGYYCYYKAEYDDGVKHYDMRGRIIIVAEGNALYQVRITTPRTWYSYYENVFRRVCSSFRFSN